MTARPVFAANRRKVVFRKAALIIFLIAIILLIIPVNATITAIQSDDGKTVLSNGSFWIRVDPVNDSGIGDPFFLKGETDLPVNSKIFGALEFYIRIEDPTILCRTKTCDIELYTFSNESSILGNNSINSFSIPLDTKKLLPGTYYYVINSDIGRYTSSYNFTLISNLSAPTRSTTSQYTQQMSDSVNTQKSNPPSPVFLTIVGAIFVMVFINKRK